MLWATRKFFTKLTQILIASLSALAPRARPVQGSHPLCSALFCALPSALVQQQASASSFTVWCTKWGLDAAAQAVCLHVSQGWVGQGQNSITGATGHGLHAIISPICRLMNILSPGRHEELQPATPEWCCQAVVIQACMICVDAQNRSRRVANVSIMRRAHLDAPAHAI